MQNVEKVEVEKRMRDTRTEMFVLEGTKNRAGAELGTHQQQLAPQRQSTITVIVSLSLCGNSTFCRILHATQAM